MIDDNSMSVSLNGNLDFIFAMVIVQGVGKDKSSLGQIMARPENMNKEYFSPIMTRSQIQVFISMQGN